VSRVIPGALFGVCQPTRCKLLVTFCGVRVAVLAEKADGERRVAAVPETVRRLTGAGWEVAVERGAGLGSFVADEAYVAAGASVVADLADLVRNTDVLLSVQPASMRTLAVLPENATVISMLAPSTYPEHIRACADYKLVSFALELVPRITRAQAMDVLSSQALVAGYRAALAAAVRLPGFFPMFMTAAGTVPPAKVLVLGAGVAGLQAIATARRLGAVTSAYDVRPSSADEVKSLGATFLSLELETQEGVGGYARAQSDDFLAQQRQLLMKHVGESDAVITTAAVPGRRAPMLVTTEMVEQMRPGSVIVDLAAETGGNCELTRPGEEIDYHGVLIYGPRNVPSELPRHASELFSRNVTNLLMLMTKDGAFAPDFDDEVLAGCLVTRDGEVVHPVAREALGEPDVAVTRPVTTTGTATGGTESPVERSNP
jgi:NAD(P) transhydrogenase subunit alpha